MNSVHDIGGMDGFGKIELSENEERPFEYPWEGRLHGIQLFFVRKHGLYHLHEFRHALERMDPVYYLTSTYYQKWLLGLESFLIERNVMTKEEYANKVAEKSSADVQPENNEFRRFSTPIPSQSRRMSMSVSDSNEAEEAKEAKEPKYQPGDMIQAKSLAPIGHTRIPSYVRGKKGVIQTIHGQFPLPDAKVHEQKEILQPVYLVCFEAQELWGSDASPKDKLCIELWEDYIETKLSDDKGE